MTGEAVSGEEPVVEQAGQRLVAELERALLLLVQQRRDELLPERCRGD